jgi:prophage regulatory protein
MAAKSSTDEQRRDRRILRRAEVEQKTGFKRAHLYQLMKRGQFPKPARLGVRAVGWDAAEVDQWIADRLKERT